MKGTFYARCVYRGIGATDDWSGRYDAEVGCRRCRRERRRCGVGAGGSVTAAVELIKSCFDSLGCMKEAKAQGIARWAMLRPKALFAAFSCWSGGHLRLRMIGHRPTSLHGRHEPPVIFSLSARRVDKSRGHLVGPLLMHRARNKMPPASAGLPGARRIDAVAEQIAPRSTTSRANAFGTHLPSPDKEVPRRMLPGFEAQRHVRRAGIRQEMHRRGLEMRPPLSKRSSVVDR